MSPDDRPHPEEPDDEKDEASEPAGSGEESPPESENVKGNAPKYPEPRKLPKGLVRTGAAPAGYFTVYKKGQGYWTRMGTAGGAALFCVLTANFAYEQAGGQSGPMAMAVGGATAAILLAICWHFMNKPISSDFLIATDSEMKKVNWTKPADLIASTKIVILFMFGIAVFLFVVDILFGYLFAALGVTLKPF